VAVAWGAGHPISHHSRTLACHNHPTSSCSRWWCGVQVPLVPLVPSISLSPSHTHTTHIAPLSTPQAIARGSGWGCFMGLVSSSPFPLAHPPSRLPSPSSFLHCHCHRVIPVPLLHSSRLSPSHPLAVLLPYLDSSPANHPTSSCL